MHTISSAGKFFLNLGKTQAILAHRFDRGLGGLGFSEFLILYYLNQAENQKLPRVDLAEKVGLTASGVTRLLLPMEKIHLVKSGPTENDARVRLVMITPAGKEKLSEAIERINTLGEDIVPSEKLKNLEMLSNLLVEIGGKALMV